MQGNNGATTTTLTNRSLEDEMAALDALPKVVREAIYDCAVRFSPYDILTALITQNVTPEQLAAGVRRQASVISRRDWLKVFGYDYVTGRAPPS